MIIEQLRVLGLEVGGTVLEPEQVARSVLGLGRGRGPSESQLHPPRGHDSESHAHQVVHGVDGHLRVIGARLDAQVSPGARRIQGVTRKVRQFDERLGHVLTQSETVLVVLVHEQ